MRLFSRAAFFLLATILLASASEGATARMTIDKINLPKTVGVWTRTDSPRLIDSKNIFDYMNGAGELYLGYLFDHLEVYEYTADNEKNIVVEIYYMKTSDDAFGLLSLDWGGEPVSFTGTPANRSNQSLTSPTKALYGAGLLRIWSDTLYSRVMAFADTPASKQAVLTLGKAIGANRQSSPEPELLKILPAQIGTGWKLRNDRLGYFRSHLVLNSLYYLSHQNILNLDLSTEAVTAPYDRIDDGDLQRIQLIFVKYADLEQAQQALDHFHKSYLPEHKKDSAAGSKTKSPGFFKIEDGWLGYKLHGLLIALVFSCPDEEAARMIIKQIQFNKNGG
jgi:hypothetical protein